MTSRRLLVLCYFYPPLAGGGVHRVLGFTRHLPAHGWNCTVICAGEEDYWVTDDSLSSRVPAGTQVVRVPGGSGLASWLRLFRPPRGRRPGRLFSGLRMLSGWWMMPDSYSGWAHRAERRARRLLEPGSGPRFDAILSSSPPDSVHVAARSLARRSGLPWVADFRDPWIHLHLIAPRTAWHRERQARMEREVLGSADLVIAASATHARELERRAGADDPPIRRVVHLPNGFEPDSAAEDADAGKRIATPAPGSDSFELVYTGVLSLMPDVGVFLEALHELLARRPEARRRLRARLAGPYDSDYADRAIALGLTGIVQFTGPLPHAEARALQRRADLLLLWKPRGCPTMVPGKIYEYFEAGRPVVALLDSADEAAERVREAGGVVIAPGDRLGLAAEIERRYERWRAGGREASGRPEWLAAHTRERLSARLAALLDETVGSRS